MKSRLASAVLVTVVLCLCLLAQEANAADRDFYKILGVPRDAGNKQIRKAFRDLSLKWHPDKNPNDPTAKDKYSEINNAYEVLIDEEKRRMYDQFGEEGLKPGAGKRARSPFDIFGFGGGGGSGPNNMQKGANLELPLFVSLEDLYLGKEVKVANRRQVLCTKCRGTGAKDPDDIQKCNECGGTGTKVTTRQLGPGFVQQMQTTCPKCDGKGKIAKSKCPHCHGTKVEVGEEEMMIIIEKGMPDQHKLVFSQEADQAPNTVPGDVVFTVVTQPHPTFRREGHSLYTKMTITLLEALIGFKKDLIHLDKRAIPVKRDGITIPGQVMRLPREGFPHHEFPSETGDLYIEFVVAFPKSLTKEQKDAFKELLGFMQ